MQTIPKDIPPFEGFPRELRDFLWGLSFNNEKPWFLAHKEEYERCLHQPVQALAWQLRDRLEERMPGLAPEVHISRIYRDARRLYGRGPFNDHLWFSLGVTAQLYTAQPQYWFGIHAESYNWGLGVWNIDGAALERWRDTIDADPAPLSRIVRKVNKIEGLEFMGQTYKRLKGDPGPLLYDWYNTRDIAVGRTVWFDPDPPGPELLDEMTEAFCQLAPLYKYLMKI